MTFSRIPIVRKVMIPLVLVNLVLAAVALGLMEHTKRENIELTGRQVASALQQQLSTLRVFYSGEIVPRAKKAGMSIDADFTQRDNVLPVPATFVNVLGEQIAREFPGTRVRLYSQYPFGGGELRADAFELDALEALEKDPKSPFGRIEEVEGRLSVRYAVADVMGASCVACHNSHPRSTKRDWAVGDVRGALEVVVPVDAVARQLDHGNLTVVGALAVGMIVINVVTLLVLRRAVLEPVSGLRGAVQRIGDGDLTVALTVPYDDEVGDLANAFNLAIAKMRNAIEALVSRTELLVASTRGLTDVASLVGANAEQASVALTAVSTSAEGVTARVASVAAASEELSVTVREIAGNVSHTTQVVANAASMSRAATSAMGQLGESSAAIGNIVDTIRNITEQTRLLSLNATIEAARAGTAGKGFAVVANEVKNLAAATARAAENIGAKMTAIQKDTDRAIELIREIVSVIGQIHELQSAVGNAVEQQALTTAESSQNISEIATINADVASNLSGVAQASAGIATGMAEARSAIQELRQVAEALEGLIRQFRV